MSLQAGGLRRTIIRSLVAILAAKWFLFASTNNAKGKQS